MKKYREQMFEREQTGSQADVLSPPNVTDSLGNKGQLVKVLSEGKKVDDHISDLSQVEVNLLSKLEQLIKRDRLFLNPKLKIELLASKIGETERILSNLLNRHHGCNFSVYINRFRVVEARMLLERPDSMNLKLDAIGQSAGFGSRQNFYAVFEQDTGVNPGYYRSSIHG
jgi:AraC-like DNA-binding protein